MPIFWKSFNPFHGSFAGWFDFNPMMTFGNLKSGKLPIFWHSLGSVPLFILMISSKVRQLVLGWIVLLDSMPQARGKWGYTSIYICVFQDSLEFRWEAVPVFFKSESLEKSLKNWKLNSSLCSSTCNTKPLQVCDTGYRKSITIVTWTHGKKGVILQSLFVWFLWKWFCNTIHESDSAACAKNVHAPFCSFRWLKSHRYQLVPVDSLGNYQPKSAYLHQNYRKTSS